MSRHLAVSMYSRFVPLSLLLTVLLTFTACSSDSSTGPSAQPADVPELTVTNSTGYVVSGINIAPCTDPYWGANLIQTNLQPGNVREFQLAGGCYDVRVLFASNAAGLAGITYWNRQVVAGETTPVVVSE